MPSDDDPRTTLPGFLACIIIVMTTSALIFFGWPLFNEVKEATKAGKSHPGRKRLLWLVTIIIIAWISTLSIWLGNVIVLWDLTKYSGRNCSMVRQRYRCSTHYLNMAIAAGPIGVLASLGFFYWQPNVFGDIGLIFKFSPGKVEPQVDLEAQGNAPPSSPPRQHTLSTTPPPSRAPSPFVHSNPNEQSNPRGNEVWTTWSNKRPTSQNHHETSQHERVPSPSLLPPPPIPSSPAPSDSDEPSNLRSNDVWAAWSHDRRTHEEHHQTNQQPRFSLRIPDEADPPHQQEWHSVEGQIDRGSSDLQMVGDEAYTQPVRDGADIGAMESHPPLDSPSPQRPSSAVEAVPSLVSDHGSSDLDRHRDASVDGLRSSGLNRHRVHSCLRARCPSCSNICTSTFPHTDEASVREPLTPPDPPEDPQWLANAWAGAMRTSTQDGTVPYESVTSPLPRTNHSRAEMDGARLNSVLAGINPRIVGTEGARLMNLPPTEADSDGGFHDPLSPERESRGIIGCPFHDLSEASSPHESTPASKDPRNESEPWSPYFNRLRLQSQVSIAEADKEPQPKAPEEVQDHEQKLQSNARQQQTLENNALGHTGTGLFQTRRGIPTPPYTEAPSSASSPGRGSNIPNPPAPSPWNRVPGGPRRINADTRLAPLSNGSHQRRLSPRGLRTALLTREPREFNGISLTQGANGQQHWRNTVTELDTPPSTNSNTPPSAQGPNDEKIQSDTAMRPDALPSTDPDARPSLQWVNYEIISNDTAAEPDAPPSTEPDTGPSAQPVKDEEDRNDTATKPDVPPSMESETGPCAHEENDEENKSDTAMKPGASRSEGEEQFEMFLWQTADHPSGNEHR